MNSGLDLLDDMAPQPGANQPLLRGSSPHLGWFQFHFDDDQWVWSPQVEHMHGYRPGTVTPGTRLVLSHVHPDDHQRVADTLHQSRHRHHPFSSHHRIIDVRDATHHLAMLGAPFVDGNGVVIGVQGACLDMTSAARPAASTAQSSLHAKADKPQTHTKGQAEIRAATPC